MLILVVAAAMLTGCDRGERNRAGARVDLRFWNGFTGPDGRTMLAIVKRFNDANPDVHVTMQRMEWGTYYNKLFVAGLGGRAPEVFVIQTDSLARFTQANFVRGMDDLTGAGGIDAGDFDENVWRAVERDGKHYGIPLDIHLLGMYYNRKLFREAGIARPPTNREEFVAALKKFRHDDQWGFVYTWQRTNIYAAIRQNGGDIFNAGRTEATLNSPQNVEALQWCADLIVKEHLVPPPQDFDAWIGFRQGKVAMAVRGVYMLPDLGRQQDLDYWAALIPLLFKQRAGVRCNSHNLYCLRADLSERRSLPRRSDSSEIPREMVTSIGRRAGKSRSVKVSQLLHALKGDEDTDASSQKRFLTRPICRRLRMCWSTWRSMSWRLSGACTGR